MKKLTLGIFVIVCWLNAWEINTHRAIDRKAIEKSENLQIFVKNSGIQNIDYSGEKFEGYHKDYRGDYTYTDYVTNGEGNGISDDRWTQEFPYGIPSYQKLLEAGSILEDAVYATAPLSFNGRFNNHFYDAQNGGHALTFGYGIRVNALKWGTSGVHAGSFLRENKYSYNNTLEYFKKAFTEENPNIRKKYQAKMLVGVGHLMHLMNDMTRKKEV